MFVPKKKFKFRKLSQFSFSSFLKVLDLNKILVKIHWFTQKFDLICFISFFYIFHFCSLDDFFGGATKIYDIFLECFFFSYFYPGAILSSWLYFTSALRLVFYPRAIVTLQIVVNTTKLIILHSLLRTFAFIAVR